MNEGTSGLGAERVRALGALSSLGFKKNLAAEKRGQMHFLSNEEKEIWIEDYVERETAGGIQRVEDAEAATRQEQADTDTAENAELTTSKPEKTFHEMMVATGDNMSDIANTDDGEDGEDENDEDRDPGKLSEDDQPGWVMGTISKMVQQCMERLRQKQIKIDELTQPGSGDTAKCFRENDNMYGISDLRFPAVIKPQTNQDVAAPDSTTFGEHLERLDIVP